MKNKQTIVFGGGCFWCIEAVYRRLKGVLDVTSGYAGGDVPNPTYRSIHGGSSGHAEVVHVIFDVSVISLETLLDVFFSMHDPTTLNRQGYDVGTEYRSIILYTSEEQKEIIERYIETLQDDKVFQDKIVTEIKSLEKFYKAERVHQKFYEKNPDQQYCQVMIDPKIQKLREKWAHLLKE